MWMENKRGIFTGVFVFIVMFLSSYFIPKSVKEIITIIIAGLAGFIGCILAILLFKEKKR